MKEEMEIVLIEDNEDDARRMLSFLRQNFTNRIRHIQDGADAVRFLLFECDSVPKLILLDLVLPSVDGTELFRIIKAEPRERNLTVIALLSSADSKDYLNSLDIYPDGYLKKPTRANMPQRVENYRAL